MRKKTTIILTFLSLILLIPSIVFATPLDFNGGAQNEHTYEEYVYITGEPILFRGTYTVRESSSRTTDTLRYSFKLEEVGGEGRLDRNLTFKADNVEYPAIGQTTNIMELDRYSETIRIGEASYSLEDYQFSKSDVLDARPGSDFYEGSIVGRRYYKLNKDQGEVTIDMTGGNVGYENFWGSTETQIIDHTIRASISDLEGDGQGEDSDIKTGNWTGTYSHQVSDSLTKQLRYTENGANLSTIKGGHVKVANRSVVSKTNYNLPGGRGIKTLNQEMTPKLERLIIPKFRDVNGHWAEEDIKKLYSLNVFDDSNTIFSPDTPMSRLDYIKAVIRASDIRIDEEKTTSRRKKKNQAEESPFRDVANSSEGYKYIKAGLDKGLIEGISNTRFAPNDYLTRAEAVTILMRSLGYEHKAPNPGYVTSFSDDSKIPSWAKDSIYMAKEIGLITGDTNNMVKPRENLTRAQASSMIINYLEFLERGLQVDYRENIIKYN